MDFSINCNCVITHKYYVIRADIRVILSY